MTKISSELLIWMEYKSIAINLLRQIVVVFNHDVRTFKCFHSYILTFRILRGIIGRQNGNRGNFTQTFSENVKISYNFGDEEQAKGLNSWNSSVKSAFIRILREVSRNQGANFSSLGEKGAGSNRTPSNPTWEHLVLFKWQWLCLIDSFSKCTTISLEMVELNKCFAMKCKGNEIKPNQIKTKSYQNCRHNNTNTKRII